MKNETCSSVGCCSSLIQNEWNSVSFLVPLSALQTPVWQAPGKEFQEASAVAERSVLGDCQPGKVLVVCTHALFLLPLPKDVGSLRNVCGAAVVRAFAADSGCCCDTRKDYGL